MKIKNPYHISDKGYCLNQTLIPVSGNPVHF